jgi:signal transduction histidine kinase
MNIKKRLIISNTLMLIIPIIAAFAFLFIFSKAAGKNTDYDRLKKMAQIRGQLLEAASSISGQSTQRIEDVEFQQYLVQRLQGIKGKCIIIKDSSVIASPKDMNKIDIEKAIEGAKERGLYRTVEINENSYLLEAVELALKDGTSGRVILLAPSEHNKDLFRYLLISTIGVFIITFILVNVFLTYGISTLILNPLASLKKAAAEISSGNLSFEIVEQGDREVRELCRDFELMRIQLKDSINMKMKYDDNRKMLVSSISHDLKTPITSIKGYVEGILDGVANTEEKRERYLKTIYLKAQQVDHMIDDLLLYSKLDLNQLPFNFEKTDMIEYIKHCISETELELSKSNIEISFNNELQKPRSVLLDRERMRRVIVNIIDNSQKYMDKVKGKLIITLRETNTSIIAEFRDNGRGVNIGDINKIFDRFYRVDSSRTEAKGSGLGLAIAKGIVEGHKGKIWAVNHGDEGISIIISLTKIT